MKRILTIAVITVIISSLFLESVCAEPSTTALFKDIQASDWYGSAVDRLCRLNIIDGLPGGLFSPKSAITRSQFVKMLVQAMEYKKIDSISFEDIKPLPTRKAHWAAVYIETALRNGVILKEEIGNNFYPDVPITRKDMFMMMYRALKLQTSMGENPFADITEANGCFTKLFEEYLVRGTIEGSKRLFRAEGLTTRAEAAVVISRMLDYKANPADYIKTVGLETRIRECIATEEDLKLMREIELQKQAADKNYIIEPKLSVEKSPEKMYYEKFIYSYINLDNYEEFADDAQIRAVCISDETQNYSYGQDVHLRWHETRSDEWYTIGQYKSVGRPNITRVNKGNVRKSGNSYISYEYNYKPGTVLKYEIQIKRGKILKNYSVDVVIP